MLTDAQRASARSTIFASRSTSFASIGSASSHPPWRRSAPAASGAFQNQLFQILQTKATTGIKERTFTASFSQMVMYVDDISASQVALRGLLVSDERDAKLANLNGEEATRVKAETESN